MKVKATELEETFVGGGFSKLTVSYEDSPTAIRITTHHPSPTPNTGGYAEGDILEDVNHIIGSNFNDRIISSRHGTLTGGRGDDTYVVWQQDNSIQTIEHESEGFDHVETTNPTYHLQANIESLSHAGILVPFNGHGNELNNKITGSEGGPNNLYGHDGNDVLIGGRRQDVLLGGAGEDQLIGNDGKDTASYLDSPTAITFDFTTGNHSGYAQGDTFTSIEEIEGTKLSDIFIADSNVGMPFLRGSGGYDVITYANQTSGANIHVSGYHFQIETIEGSKFSDTIKGGVFDDNIIGGPGADKIDGWIGINSAWYMSSSSAVEINLTTGRGQGGDAEGDELRFIHNLKGSMFDDILIGDDRNNQIEGGPGNDTIHGGGGDDLLAGNKDTNSVTTTRMGPVKWMEPERTEPARDLIYGGDGNDTIFTSSKIHYDPATNIKSSEDESRSIAYGENGNDTIHVFSATAYGGNGNDQINGNGPMCMLYGDHGDDRINIFNSCYADGGEGSDTYYVPAKSMVEIQDTGKGGRDTLILQNVKSVIDLYTYRDGNDVYVFSAESVAKGDKTSGVILKDWYNGTRGIEAIQLANGQIFTPDF